MTEQLIRPWHSMHSPQVLKELDSSTDGLSNEEAQQRQLRFGPNSLPETRQVHPVVRFLSQFNNTLIYFLLASAIAAFLLQHAIDAVVILLVVAVNAIVGFVQEGRAEKALSGMRSLLSPHSLTVRDLDKQSIDAKALVPGDIVHLDAGDRIPADVRLLRTRSLAIEEAALTGESLSANKSEPPVEEDVPLGDRTSMGYSGTLVVRGQATGVVVATGQATEIGRISGMLLRVPPLVTPLLRQIDRLGHWLTLIILAVGVLLFLIAVYVRGFDWADALIAVVAIAVGAIPEGLPAVITVTLAIGVQRMAQRHAVIRKLPAVESLGATSVICSDKTGTLTRNEMTVARLFTIGREFAVSGSGYAPEGIITPDDGGDAVTSLVLCGMICNDARLVEQLGNWSVVGDPMEGALLSLGQKAGQSDISGWTRIDEIPFDARYRYMAVLAQAPDERRYIFIKGAPEAVISLCPDSTVEEWSDAMEKASSNGERLLGFAMKAVPSTTVSLGHQFLEGAEFLGVMGFVDPPRDEARLAISACRSAGISIKMITGDHAGTAIAIARQLEIADDPKSLSGTEIEAMDDAQLAGCVEGVDVFARANPEHKRRIVRALQSHGHIVAMTGDGVNDSPSLKQADVGTAMGISGTEAAREASEMVLLDDNFASIVAAVQEGRTVYDNIQKVIAWTLPTNGGEAAVVILAILMGFTLPITATQILWINLVTAVTLGLVLAFEPPEPGVMERPPRAANAPLITGAILWRVVLVSALFALVVLFVFFGTMALGGDLQTARTMVVNMLVVAEIFYLFNIRFLHQSSIAWNGVMGTKPVLVALAVVIAAQLAFTYLPVLQDVFDTRPLSLAQGLIIILIGLVLFLVMEAEKLISSRKFTGAPPKRVSIRSKPDPK